MIVLAETVAAARDAAISRSSSMRARRARTPRTSSVRCSPRTRTFAASISRCASSPPTTCCTSAAAGRSTRPSRSRARRATARARGRGRTRSRRPPASSIASRRSRPIEHAIDGLLYRTTTTVTLANGGRGRNVVPDVFTLNLNHRFAPNTSLEQAQADVRDARRRRRAPRVHRPRARRDAERLAPARAEARRRGRPRRRAEAGVDRRCALLGARHRRRQLRAGRERAGPPEERVDGSLPLVPGLQNPLEVARARSTPTTARFDDRFGERPRR